MNQMAHPRNTARILIMVLMILILPMIIVLASMKMLVFSHEFYANEVERLNVTAGYAEAPVLSRQVADYYIKDTPLPEDKLDERAIVHLQDVKKVLINLIYALYALMLLYALLIFVLYKTSKNFTNFLSHLKKSLLGGSILLLILLAVSLIVFSSFHYYFTKFHYLFFQEGTWNFPEESNLIRTFPEQFFVDAAIGIILNSALISLGIAAVSFLAIKFRSTR